MTDITSKITNLKTPQTHESIIIGVSGGPDSLCLLHNLVFLQAALDLRLHVAHLNHGLRGEEAFKDAEFLRSVVESWGVPFYTERVDVPVLAAERSSGIEEVARQERYAFLARVADRVGARKVAVGHNADDQAETVLMHLLRGAGLAGLRGMQPIAPYPLPNSNLVLVRPLLETSRSAIEEYCQKHNLRPRLDPSNQDTSFFRNKLRHQVLPALEKISPGLSGRLCHLAQVAAADFTLLEELLDDRWGDLLIDQSATTISLNLAVWQGLPLSLRRLALRRVAHLLVQSSCDLGFEHIESARKLAEGGKTGARLSLPGRLKLAISYERLTISAGEPDIPSTPDWPLLITDSVVCLNVPGRANLPNADWQAVAELLPADEATRAAATTNSDPWCVFLDAEVVGPNPIFRSRRSGECFQPLGMKGKRSSVSDFMINCRIPASYRNQIPILARPEHLLWIAGWRIDERAKVTPETDRIVRISFTRTRIAKPDRNREIG